MASSASLSSGCCASSGCAGGSHAAAAQLPFCKVGPSILNSNLACLADECDRLLAAGADYLHLDIMDGHFVPNLTFGAPVVRSLRSELAKRREQSSNANNPSGDDKKAGCEGGDQKPLGPCERVSLRERPFFEAHMMVSRPGQWVADMAEAGVDQFTFHLEAAQEDPRPVIRLIRERGMRVGLAINPATKLGLLEPWADLVDCVLVMTVVPGFGGQAFMPSVLPKVRRLRARYPELDIEVDGGLGLNTVDQAAEAGANMIVAGSAVISSPDPGSVIRELRRRTQVWEDRRRAGELPQAAEGEAADADEDPRATKDREEEDGDQEA